MESNNVRREHRHLAGRFRSAKMTGIMAVPFLGGEAGLVHQTIGAELDPVAGKMLSQTFLNVAAVVVPIQAIDALVNPEDPNAGMTEPLRRKIMDGEPLFGLEPEGEISKRLGIEPRSVSGQRMVSSIARIAHNASVNHLRKRRYIYADLLDADNAAVTPAIISETVLDRFQGVLDPDDHANGKVGLTFSENRAPVLGIGVSGSTYNNPANLRQTDGTTFTGGTGTGDNAYVSARENPDLPGYPGIYADLEAIEAGGFTIADLFNAQKADRLIRTMRGIADANPEEGEDAVLRWVFGLQADSNRHPYVVYENRIPMGEMRRAATDATGLLDETLLTYQTDVIDFQVPIPSSELGGVLITFAWVTPDEVISHQPHPILSDNWTAANHAASQMALDPEPVIYRELFADVQAPADETAPKFYAGHNALKRTYVNYGFSRQTDLSTVDAKTVLWQYAIPAGVTPENILYPEDFPQYPFLDQEAEICTYTIKSVATIRTPMFFGPTPVERLAIVDEHGLLENEQ